MGNAKATASEGGGGSSGHNTSRSVASLRHGHGTTPPLRGGRVRPEDAAQLALLEELLQEELGVLRRTPCETSSGVASVGLQELRVAHRVRGAGLGEAAPASPCPE